MSRGEHNRVPGHFSWNRNRNRNRRFLEWRNRNRLGRFLIFWNRSRNRREPVPNRIPGDQKKTFKHFKHCKYNKTSCLSYKYDKNIKYQLKNVIVTRQVYY